MPVTFERAKVAVSVAELGTVAGVQLAAVFQLPLAGLRFHVALPAKALLHAKNRLSTKATIFGIFFIGIARCADADVELPRLRVSPESPLSALSGSQ